MANSIFPRLRATFHRLTIRVLILVVKGPYLVPISSKSGSPLGPYLQARNVPNSFGHSAVILCLKIILFFLRELGYDGASQHTTQSYFGQVSNEFGMDEVQCTGNEDSIFDCPHQTTENCGGSEGLGVICSTGECNQLPRVRYPQHSYNDNY